MTAATTAIRREPLAPKLSVPRRGHVLTSIAGVYGEPIRRAAAEIAADLDRRRPDLCFGMQEIAELPAGPAVVRRRPTELAAWHLCTQWVVGNALGLLDPDLRWPTPPVGSPGRKQTLWGWSPASSERDA